MKLFLADLILIIHFAVVLFIIFGFCFPIFYKFKFNFAKNYYIRIIHISLITIVLVETLAGVICPLTIIENLLRNSTQSESLIAKLLRDLLFWDFSISYFLLIYFVCFSWTVFIWFFFPPNKKIR